MYRLSANHITVTYEHTPVIEDISIYLKQGEIVSLLGVSGVGKTTLFNVLSGLLIPDRGTVLLEGDDITGSAGRISYMLQKDLLLPFKTIEENVALPLIIQGKKKKAAIKEAVKHFPSFGLESTEQKYPHQLSGGMRQRAALLRTYLFSDQVALLDEPFSALDTITKGAMHQWYLEILDQIKLSTLFITHDIDEAIYLSDRIYIMAGKPGKIVHSMELANRKTRGKDFIVSPQFTEYKKEILSILNQTPS